MNTVGIVGLLQSLYGAPIVRQRPTLLNWDEAFAEACLDYRPVSLTKTMLGAITMNYEGPICHALPNQGRIRREVQKASNDVGLSHGGRDARVPEPEIRPEDQALVDAIGRREHQTLRGNEAQVRLSDDGTGEDRPEQFRSPLDGA